MIIILLNDEFLQPQGEIISSSGGVSIKQGEDTHFIPYTQIKSIFESTDTAREDEFLRGVQNMPKVKPIGPLSEFNKKSTNELIAQLYGK